MKIKERKRMKVLENKYYDKMQTINDLHTEFLKSADKFRMNCVKEIGKLMDQDKELKKLREEAEEVWKKNQRNKK